MGCIDYGVLYFCTVRKFPEVAALTFPSQNPSIVATPTKTAAGNWRLQFEVEGVRISNTLPTKREIQEWAAKPCRFEVPLDIAEV